MKKKNNNNNKKKTEAKRTKKLRNDARLTKNERE